MPTAITLQHIAVHLAVVALAVTAITATAHEEEKKAASAVLSHSPHFAVIGRAPDFTLLDTKGQRLQLAQLRGRTVLLAFVYTTCASACPLLSYRMGLLQTTLADAGAFPARVAMLSVTVDPARDTAAALARYAGGFDARPGWYFLRDSPERMRPVLHAYDEWTRLRPDGELDHPARLYLIDPAGRIREIYSLAFFDERQAFLDILAVDREARGVSRK